MRLRREKHTTAWLPFFMLLALLLVACRTANSATDTTTNVILTDTPVLVAQEPSPTPTSTAEPTPLALPTMVIWWPEPLAPLNNAEANEVLSEQISAFKAAQGNLEVQLRRKLEGGLGGVLSTLRTASPVAPGALPDLTLMRRSDLMAAAQAGLIYPIEGQISSVVSNDLYQAALALGRVDGDLYGLPYMIHVEHMAYHIDELSDIPATFDDMLDDNVSFALPVSQADQINSVLMTQYVDAGGELPQAGSDAVNADALFTTLKFYEDAVAAGLVNPAVINYTSAEDYQSNLVAGTLDAGIVNSTLFLNLMNAGVELDFGSVPTESGTTTGQLNGWMWVMTTSSTDRQALAARFINWMMNSDRQGAYSRAVNMIPSQRAALLTWEDGPYMRFLGQVLDNAVLPLSDAEGGLTGRAMQNALIAVLSRESTAEEATQALLNRLSG